MAFDECPDPNKPREYQQLAVERTLRWAELCIEAHARKDEQALFGIVQGGTDESFGRPAPRV
jgi:queuine tRNA-ribosyltransferase